MNRDFLFGAHSVGEWLKSHPERIESLVTVQSPNDRVRKLIARAQAHGIPVERVSPEQLKKLARPKNPQGIGARVKPYAFAKLEQVLSTQPRVLLAIDGVTDPGNLGAIIRSASFFGVDAVLLPRDRSASITPVVERAAAGAVANIPLCQVNSMVRSLTSLQASGFKLVGSIVGPHPAPHELGLVPPVVVIVGSEGKGIRPSVRRICDIKTALRTRGPQSLNVSAFTSVILYEVGRQIN